MTARQPRRTRRRVAPATALPRPLVADDAGAAASRTNRRASTLRHREHHIARDYSHVHKDLVTVSIVGTVILGFIVAMSFVVQ